MPLVDDVSTLIADVFDVPSTYLTFHGTKITFVVYDVTALGYFTF
jgi:hypothetical protein